MGNGWCVVEAGMYHGRKEAMVGGGEWRWGRGDGSEALWVIDRFVVWFGRFERVVGRWCWGCGVYVNRRKMWTRGKMRRSVG